MFAMMRAYHFLFCIFFTTALQAQLGISKDKGLSFLKETSLTKKRNFTHHPSDNYSSILPLPIDLPSPSFSHSCYSYNDLAIFCKLEVQMEKAFKMPFKFRVGSVEYVDRLEGK